MKDIRNFFLTLCSQIYRYSEVDDEAFKKLFFIAINIILSTSSICVVLGIGVFLVGPTLAGPLLNAIQEFIGITGIKISLCLLSIFFGLSLVFLHFKPFKWIVRGISSVSFTLNSTATGVFLGLIIPALLTENNAGLDPTLIGLFTSFCFLLFTIFIIYAANPNINLKFKARIFDLFSLCEIKWVVRVIGIIFLCIGIYTFSIEEFNEIKKCTTS